jgi:uncharacterized membrane protein
MLKFRQILSNLRASFWFVPSLIVLVSIILAIALIEADTAGSDRWLAQWPRLFGVGAEGSRQMLSTLAGSMMTVLGVTFSMTLVALTLASSQYTSRILRIFMRSKITQITLGVFAGTFTYCLIVLRTIRSHGAVEFIPGLAVFLGFVLALASVGVLIFFIHHIASSIQASSLIASVAQETCSAIDRLFPGEKEWAAKGKEENEEELLRLLNEKTWCTVPANKSGYIQSVNSEALLRLAWEKKTILRMERSIGDFVVKKTALASLDLEEDPDNETAAAINAAYNISIHRTIDQDPAFGVRQLVDIALKALSPGVNDTSTAVMCVDHLTAILAHLADRQFPPSRLCKDGELRVIKIAPTFESLLSDSFDQIRRSAAGNVSIMARIISALDSIASLTGGSPRSRQALREQMQRIAELAERTIESTHDRTYIRRRLMPLREALEAELALESEEEIFGKGH